MSMNNWNDAKGSLEKARKLAGLIGKPQRTTYDGVGHLHSISVKATICYQEVDGAKNYHDDKALDKALSEVVKERFDELCAAAIERLECEVAETGKVARASVQSMLDQIDQYDEAGK